MTDWYDADDELDQAIDLGTDAIEGDGSDGLGEALTEMDGNDLEANRWNTERDAILEHADDVAAGTAKSGEQIVQEMYDIEKKNPPT